MRWTGLLDEIRRMRYLGGTKQESGPTTTRGPERKTQKSSLTGFSTTRSRLAPESCESRVVENSSAQYRGRERLPLSPRLYRSTGGQRTKRTTHVLQNRTFLLALDRTILPIGNIFPDSHPPWFEDCRGGINGHVVGWKASVALQEKAPLSSKIS